MNKSQELFNVIEESNQALQSPKELWYQYQAVQAKRIKVGTGKDAKYANEQAIDAIAYYEKHPTKENYEEAIEKLKIFDSYSL